MRKLIVVAGLLVAVQSQANEIEGKCGAWSELAEQVAEMRYSGYVPMREAMAAVENEFAEAIIRDAYALPDYRTKEVQQNTIRSFSDKIYRVCYNKLEDQ